MKFLYLLEKIRNPFMDFLFSIITHLGEETAFLAIALFIFWCVSKRRGYFLMITGFFGMIVNQAMKITFKVPRPWMIDHSFSVVDGAKAEATGYSFPSGHTQMSVGTFGALAMTSKRKWISITLSVIAGLVCFSRMYLGVHTPWDVLASVGIAVILLIVLEPYFSDEEKFKKSMPVIIGAIVAASFAYAVYSGILYYSDITDKNFVSGFQSGCMLVGCAVGIIPVYILDRKFINFKTEGKWYVQVIKLAVGLGLTVGLKSLLKLAFLPLMGQFYERALRYFLIVLFAGAAWPSTFGFISKLSVPALDRFGAWVSGLFSGKKTTAADETVKK